MDYRYRNRYGRLVEVPEELASKIHSKMTFIERSDGQKIPPPSRPKNKQGEFVDRVVLNDKGREIDKALFFAKKKRI